MGRLKPIGVCHQLELVVSGYYLPFLSFSFLSAGFSRAWYCLMLQVAIFVEVRPAEARLK
jgi:hypothetical protein